MTEEVLWKEANTLSPFMGYSDDWGEDRAPDEVRATRDQAAKMTGIAMKEYWSPFDDYGNIEIDAGWFDGTRDAEWRELKKKGAPLRHGLEIERSKGFIAITEQQPIAAVSVLGSACKTDVYVICDYPQPGLTTKEPRRQGQEGWNL